jgi:sulfite exporter TauE/SafE
MPDLLPASILIASLLGSAHCVAMCGGIMVAVAPSRSQQAVYHLGRLIAYGLLGALAGTLGEWAYDMGRIGSWVSIAMGVGLMLVGLVQFAGRGRAPAFLVPLTRRLVRPLYRLGPFGMGLGSAMLPCGWLYGFVVLAAAAGSTWSGLATMVAFWLGTVPALSFVPELLNALLRRFKVERSLVTSVVFLTMGFATIAYRSVPVWSPETEERVNSPMTCHVSE